MGVVFRPFSLLRREYILWEIIEISVSMRYNIRNNLIENYIMILICNKYYIGG